jgi:transcriptional regulator with XRE-family HTH domain
VDQGGSTVPFAKLVKARLAALGASQKDLARAAKVTDSYVSQLLTQRRAPPAPERTDVYEKLESFLEIPRGELVRLVRAERAEQARRRLAAAPTPLFREFRDLVLRKCVPERREQVRAVFEREPFGTLERLVAQKLLEVVQGVAREELDSESWLRLAARVGDRSHEEMRVLILEFLDTDIFQVSSEGCLAFLDPLLESWDIDLESFRVDIRLHRRLVAVPRRTFAFTEIDGSEFPLARPGFAEFLADARLSGDATEEEKRFLGNLPLGGRRPTALYYYRVLQALRDPLHFREE